MNRNILIVSLVFVLFAFVFSCQKELYDSRDPNSKGMLLKDSVGNCSFITVAGDYVTNKTINDSNKLLVRVNVTVAGNYTIRTDTINGYYFRATGHFANTGQQVVQLMGIGKPIATGINHFTVYYDTSICQANITVRPAIPLAAYTLAGAPNGCTNATLTGTFTKGNPLDSTSYVTITLSVTAVGSYSIVTNIVNNYSFSGSGVFNATGMQSVRLYASGLPANAGRDTIPITVNNSTCQFFVPVILPVDYFPLTTNSYWFYDNLLNSTDSIVRTITGTVATNAGNHMRMQEQRSYSSQQFLFLKAGSNYLEYGQVGKYTTSFAYSHPPVDDLVFLKTNLFTGTTWQSVEYTDTASFGQVLSLRYNYVCEDENATVTINGNTFTNVRKILMYPEIRAQNNSWGSTSEYYFRSYAKDIGLIYEKKMNNSFIVSEMAIRRWQVY